MWCAQKIPLLQQNELSEKPSRLPEKPDDRAVDFSLCPHVCRRRRSPERKETNGRNWNRGKKTKSMERKAARVGCGGGGTMILWHPPSLHPQLSPSPSQVPPRSCSHHLPPHTPWHTHSWPVVESYVEYLLKHRTSVQFPGPVCATTFFFLTVEENIHFLIPVEM